jgi:hypothetical protein
MSCDRFSFDFDEIVAFAMDRFAVLADALGLGEFFGFLFGHRCAGVQAGGIDCS